MNPDQQTFDRLRPRLFSLAYRMLGSRADAQDMLQEAWLRWNQADPATLQSAEAWLVTVVTRLALDRLRTLKTEREAYVGAWLAEPLVEEAHHETPERLMEFSEDISIAFMWVLQRLGPNERAAFLLRQAFDLDYAEIAQMLGKSEAACRQLVHRAKEMVAGERGERPRHEVTPADHQQLLIRFMEAARSGQRDSIKVLLAENAMLIGDGGGKVPSFGKPLEGDERIANLYYATHLRLGAEVEYRLVSINGEPGLLRSVNGQIESAQAFVIEDGRIQTIYAVRNPDKLAGIPPLH
jgi:RNA polymerase sigma-70 factor (ECF subfamily)